MPGCWQHCHIRATACGITCQCGPCCSLLTKQLFLLDSHLFWHLVLFYQVSACTAITYWPELALFPFLISTAHRVCETFTLQHCNPAAHIIWINCKMILSELEYKSAQKVTQTLWIGVWHPEVEPWSESELEHTLKLTCSVQEVWPDDFQKTIERKVQLSPLFLLPSRYTHMSIRLEKTTWLYSCGAQCSFHMMLLPPFGQSDANCCAPRAVTKQINPLSQQLDRTTSLIYMVFHCQPFCLNRHLHHK